MSASALILAAGRGTRMKSSLPKALHPLAGKPMVQNLIDVAKKAGCSKVGVVVGHGYEEVKAALPKGVAVIHQKQQLGSGHAVQVAERLFAGSSAPLLVLYCDTPLLKAETLESLLRSHRASKANVTLLSADFADPTGYGRVIRSSGDRLEKLVEENDASAAEKAVREINVGCYAFQPRSLFSALKRVQRNPLKKEYYLTDAVSILAAETSAQVVRSQDSEETLGVNTRVDLAKAEAIMRRRILEHWMTQGVTVRDPNSTFIDSDVRIGQDTTLLPHTVIEQGSIIGERCMIGPFARIRGGSEIGSQVVIGNFVEIVRSRIGTGTQVKHLTYLGDAVVGEHVNIGAGTVTANYDGKNKHRTLIHDRAQVGSGTVFVAPVTMGRAAKTGAGSVVTRDTRIQDRAVYVGVPAKELKHRKK